MSKDSEPPWSEWEYLSRKGHARDTIFSDCGHSFYKVPYSIDFLVKSKISLENVTCKAKTCKAEDEYWCEIDTNYISQCNMLCTIMMELEYF